MKTIKSEYSKKTMFGPNTLNQLISQKDWPAVHDRCRTNPREIRQPSRSGGILADGLLRRSKALPLHHACAMNAPMDVILELLDMHQKATRYRESGYGRLPLHTALQNFAEPQVVLALVYEFPRALKVADDLGRLPIHYAIANGASLKVISDMLKLEPKTAHEVDHKGWTPLHVACGVGAPKIIIKWLLKANVDAIHACSNDNKTPLWFARNAKCPNDDVFQMLEEARQNLETIPRVLADSNNRTKSKRRGTKRNRKARVGEIV